MQQTLTTPNRRLWPPRTLAIGVLVLLLAVALGTYAGLRAPWGTKHPQVKEGIAMRANGENDLVMFDAEDGTQLTLYADNLWWKTDSTEGEADPPCLQKPGKKSDVEVGFLWIAGPDGCARPKALWVKCL
ncbi:hypothetical protein [Nocardioides vastitatis]|uniref:Uncharacterized protein n=1 Tax=Nocardioides vastitatis TaxID=2568655 RepID=A0ABW0ZST8_9ACTN|nr:hypothetical protein E7Z54_17375 [Nocardioides sp.]